MFFLFLGSISVACGFSFLFIRWNQLRKYWEQLGVPHLPPNPFLGSLTFIQRQNAGLWFRDMYERFNAPYIGIWLIWKPALIVNTPELARQILVKDSAIFRDRHLSSGTTDPIGGLNLFTVNDPIWTNVRRKLTNIFTSAKLRALYEYTNLKAKELVQRVKRDHKKGLELKELFVDYTTDVIGTFSLGVESNATLTSKGPLRTVTKDFMKFSVYRGLCWFSIFFWPELVDIFRFSFFPKSSTNYFKKIFKIILDQRCNKTYIRESKDLIDTLIEMKKESEDNNVELHEDFLIGQAAILLLGGFDTTAGILSYITYELAFHNDCQEKLYKELKEAEKRTGGNFDAQTVADLKYLNCVFKGQRFADMTARTALAQLFLKYQVQPRSNTPKPDEVEVECKGLFFQPGEPLRVEFIPRRESDNKLPKGLFVAQAAVFLLAGFDTSATTLTYAIYKIAHNPNVQEKLYQELKEAEQRFGTNDFGMQALREMTYMNCVISETLRKYSPMDWIDRIAIDDYKVDEKLTIKAGTPVYVNAIGMHYDPSYFPDPYKFNPDRFLPENKSNIKPYTFLPFGEGPRNCIGQRFAFMTIRSAMVVLFLNYKVQPLPNMPSPNEVKVDKISLFYTPGEPVAVNFIPRNK